MRDQKAYNKAYRLAHLSYFCKKAKEYQLAHPERIKARKKAYRLAHPEMAKKRSKIWYLKNTELAKGRAKIWSLAHPEGRQRWLLVNKQYVVDYKRKWDLKNPEYDKEYRQSPAGKESARKHRAVRRTLGFDPINKPFPGAEPHHIGREMVIYMPEKLHKSVWHSVTRNINMGQINKLAFDYLKTEMYGASN